MATARRITLDDPIFAGNVRLSRGSLDRPVQRRMQDIVAYKRVVPVYAQQTPKTPTIHAINRSAVMSDIKVYAPKVPLPIKSQPVAATSVQYVVKEQAAAITATAAIAYPETTKKAHKRSKKVSAQKFTQMALRLVAVSFLVLGSAILFRYHKATEQIVSAQALQAPNADGTEAATTTDGPLAEESDGSVKSETPTPSTYRYTVPGYKAKRITITSLGVNAFVRDVGITKNGAMATPSNIFWGGWSTQGALPGESGLAIINGHVSGPTATGVFYKLNKIAVGEVVKIEKGDGVVVSYKVVAKESVPVADASTKLYQMKGTAAAQLNIITCDGKFDSSSDSFKNRFIVYTEKI